MSTLLITGGAGFIGSALVRHLIANTEYTVVNLDSLTYAGNLESLGPARDNPRHQFVCADVADAAVVRELFQRFEPAGVIHLAAESHVDRSIDVPAIFIQTNVVGTFNMLQEARRYFQGLDGSAADRFRFLQISTDEVFGSLGKDGEFDEDSSYNPSSPYSASKASADHLARAWFRSYGLPTIVTNCSNNYGPCQFPEKLIPLTILNAIEGKRLPVYGRGENVRDWLFVEDHVHALLAVLERGLPGETYLVGGEAERRNLDVITSICRILDDARPRPDGSRHESLIQFVNDRPGHDFRYAIDSRKVREQLGWTPQERFETGLSKTVHWYLENTEWWQRVQSGAYQRARLGLGQSVA
ncbi:MAG: dTDP-glucose 4,6-dehydratase [Gemmatimonadota bacterium]